MDAVAQGKTEFIVTGIQRTGTTFLRTTLDSHPQIFCYGESFQNRFRPLKGRFRLFGPYKFSESYFAFRSRSFTGYVGALAAPKRSYGRYLDAFFGEHPEAAVGFKLMLSHLDERPGLWAELCRRGVSVIHVTRQNYLDIALSRARNREAKQAHFEKTPELSKLSIDPRDLHKELRRIQEQYARWEGLLSEAHAVLHLGYSDFVQDQSGEMERISSFLGVDDLPLAGSSLKKIHTGGAASVIENYDRVRNYFQQTDFAHFFSTTDSAD